jgi:hypothetical protein
VQRRVVRLRAVVEEVHHLVVGAKARLVIGLCVELGEHTAQEYRIRNEQDTHRVERDGPILARPPRPQLGRHHPAILQLPGGSRTVANGVTEILTSSWPRRAPPSIASRRRRWLGLGRGHHRRRPRGVVAPRPSVPIVEATVERDTRRNSANRSGTRIANDRRQSFSARRSARSRLLTNSA